MVLVPRRPLAAASQPPGGGVCPEKYMVSVPIKKNKVGLAIINNVCRIGVSCYVGGDDAPRGASRVTVSEADLARFIMCARQAVSVIIFRRRTACRGDEREWA